MRSSDAFVFVSIVLLAAPVVSIMGELQPIGVEDLMTPDVMSPVSIAAQRRGTSSDTSAGDAAMTVAAQPRRHAATDLREAAKAKGALTAAAD